MTASLNFFDQPVLALESSCDETSAAIWSGNSMLANVVSSQIDLHAKTGGVVPEVAARAHVEAVVPVLREALSEAQLEWNHIGAVVATNRPGLIGALSIGVSAAKSIAANLHVPFLGVHHLEGHVLSALAAQPDLPFPHLCLLVSGGHTELVLVRGLGRYEVVGQTRDDAAGEAFDKTARLMGFAYPGGSALSACAREGKPRYDLPKGLESMTTFDFSFSGLKTAVQRLLVQLGSSAPFADVCASIEVAIVSILVRRTFEAAEAFGVSWVTAAGGVAANRRLREQLQVGATQFGVGLTVAPLELCTDNAGMIGLAGSLRLAAGQRDTLELDCFARAELAEVIPI